MGPFEVSNYVDGGRLRGWRGMSEGVSRPGSSEGLHLGFYEKYRTGLYPRTALNMYSWSA